MGIFNFLKKIKDNQVSTATESTENNENSDELPFGWVTKNKTFIDKIQNEYSYFLNMWLDNRNSSPKEYRQALNSFVLYLRDAEKLCKTKGEYFKVWFYSILASPEYIESREKELEELVSNFEEYEWIFENKKLLKPQIIDLIKENDGIIQSELKKMFDKRLQNEVSHILYQMDKSGEIERIKEGKSYKLHYKK